MPLHESNIVDERSYRLDNNASFFWYWEIVLTCFPLQIFLEWDTSSWGSPLALRWFLDSFNKHQLIIASFSMCFCMFLPCVFPFFKNITVFFFWFLFFTDLCCIFVGFLFHPSPPVGLTCWPKWLAKRRRCNWLTSDAPPARRHSQAPAVKPSERVMYLGGCRWGVWQGFPPPGSAGRVFGTLLGIAVRNGVVIFFEWMGCDVSIYFCQHI